MENKKKRIIFSFERDVEKNCQVIRVSVRRNVITDSVSGSNVKKTKSYNMKKRRDESFSFRFECVKIIVPMAM